MEEIEEANFRKNRDCHIWADIKMISLGLKKEAPAGRPQDPWDRRIWRVKHLLASVHLTLVYRVLSVLVPQLWCRVKCIYHVLMKQALYTFNKHREALNQARENSGLGDRGLGLSPISPVTGAEASQALWSAPAPTHALQANVENEISTTEKILDFSESHSLVSE